MKTKLCIIIGFVIGFVLAVKPINIVNTINVIKAMDITDVLDTLSKFIAR